MDDFLQEAPRRVSPVFVLSAFFEEESFPPCKGRLCAQAQRLRGSALSFATDSDGKPCSGVRGDQQVSTATRRIALPFLRAGRGLPGPLSAAAPLERSFPS